VPQTYFNLSAPLQNQQAPKFSRQVLILNNTKDQNIATDWIHNLYIYSTGISKHCAHCCPNMAMVPIQEYCIVCCWKVLCCVMCCYWTVLPFAWIRMLIHTNSKTNANWGRGNPKLDGENTHVCWKPWLGLFWYMCEKPEYSSPKPTPCVCTLWCANV
jgi:hypothetical protein